jgi:SAM-dependent methyltransferase
MANAVRPMKAKAGPPAAAPASKPQDSVRAKRSGNGERRQGEGRVPPKGSVFDHPDVWYGLEEDFLHGAVKESNVKDVLYLLALQKKYGKIPIKRVLELTCGTCPHGRLFAARGMEVLGIDYSAAMLKEAVRLARDDGVRVRTFRASTETFALPEEYGAFDVATCLSETLPYGFEAKTGKQHNDAHVTHFRSVARVLRPGALYFMDWGRIIEPVPRLVRRHLTVEDRTIDIGHAVVHKVLRAIPDDVEENISVLEQSTLVVYKKDGRTLDLFDTWRMPIMYPVPFFAALVALSGCFEFLGAFEYGRLKPGLRGRMGTIVWVLLRRNDAEVPPAEGAAGGEKHATR